MSSGDPEALTRSMRAIEEAFLLGLPGVTEVWLIRHGDCYQDLQDRADPPLSEAGREQAKRLAARLRRIEISAVYSSPLQRATQTAHEYSGQVTLDQRLVEIGNDAGAAASAPLNRFVVYTEEPASVQARLRAAVDDAIAAHAGGRVVMFTHGGSILAYLCEVMRLEFGRLRLLPYYTSVSVIRAREGRRMVGSLADVSHLES